MEKNTQKKKKRQNILRFLYIGATIVAILLIGLLNHDIDTLKEIIPKINKNWIGIAVLAIVFFWLSDALLLKQVTSYIFEKQKFRKSLKIGIMGLYYGALTPFSSGGQPMQVVYMRREGIPVGTSTSIVTVKFIVYELSLCLLYIIAMIVKGSFFYENYHHIFWLTTAGFILNLLAVAFISMVMLNRSFTEKFVHGFIHFLSKIKIIRKEEKRTSKIDTLIDDFFISSTYIKNDIKHFFISIIISVINLAFLFAIPYFIYRAFGLTNESFILIFTLQAFLFLAVSFVPLPGAAGASEGGFYIFFSKFFGSIPIFMPMIIWRFLTYYLILVVGSIFVVTAELRHIHRSKRNTQKKRSEN